MRIGVVNWSRRLAGGAEHYLANVMPALESAGHTLALWTECELPAGRPEIVPRDRVATFTATEMGLRDSVVALGKWAPDIVFCHGLQSPAAESRILDIAPAVFLVHGYYGTCISGAKSFQLPTPRPCHRRFGPACFAFYYPRRCGGLSPVAMVREYSIQQRRLELLERYAMVVTTSDHMRDEYLNHGLPAQRVRKITHTIGAGGPSLGRLRPGDAPWHLVFIGRMERTKGGRTLLDAVHAARPRLGGRAVRLTLAGDGPERARWEQHAELLRRADPSISTTFAGWVDEPRLGAILDDADLLVFPSTWPEPFGLVGPEAGLRGVPVAAFNVGGVTEWLEDGVNGYLAPGEPPTVAGLADAIARCLATPDTHRRLRDGAVSSAKRFSMVRHLAELEGVLSAARTSRARDW